MLISFSKDIMRMNEFSLAIAAEKAEREAKMDVLLESSESSRSKELYTTLPSGSQS